MYFATLEDLDGNFWEQNPELKFIDPFSEFMKKKNSSEIMKAIYLVYDFKSKFNIAGVSEDEAKKDIEKNFLKIKNFDWLDYHDIIEAYKDKCTTKVQKALQRFEKDLTGLQDYLDRLSWEDDEEAMLKKDIIKDIDSFYKKYKECEALVKEEMREKRYKGGYRKSPAEKLSTES